MTTPRLVMELRRLGKNSLVYAVSGVATSGIAFLLLPLYTRRLSAADFGIMALTSSVSAVLSPLCSLGLHGALSRVYLMSEVEVGSRRSLVGVLATSMALNALLLTVFIGVWGESVFAQLLPGLPFVPYLQLALGISLANTLALLPLSLLQVQERPALYGALRVGTSILTNGLIIFLVFRHPNATSFLQGSLGGAIIAAFAGLVILSKESTLKGARWSYLKLGLGFGLPVIPHLLASWVNDLSDRIILQHYVPLGELGLYNIGYQVSALMMLGAAALNSSWIPFFFRNMREDNDQNRKQVTLVATYFVLALCAMALPFILLSRYIIWLFTASSFHQAYKITEIVTTGYLLSALYFIPGNFLTLRQRTSWLLPLVTVISGALNIALNLAFVPRYGIMASAWSTLATYACTCLLSWGLALFLYPFPFEFRRILSIISLTAGILGIAACLPELSPTEDLLTRALLLVFFPVLLLATGIVSEKERKSAINLLRRKLTTDSSSGGSNLDS